VLSRARYRRSYGSEGMRASLPSRFLAEIPADLIEAAAGSESEPGETRHYEADPEFSQDDRYLSSRPPYRSPAFRRPAPARSSYQQKPSRAAHRGGDPLVGTRVRHSRFGLGTIIEVEGEGEDRRLTVSFQDYGPKKLLERYANLQLA